MDSSYSPKGEIWFSVRVPSHFNWPLPALSHDVLQILIFVTANTTLRFLKRQQTVPTYCFFFVALRPNAGHGIHILEVSRAHTTTHHSLDELSASSRDLSQTTTQHSHKTNIYATSWDSNPQSLKASSRRLKP